MVNQSTNQHKTILAKHKVQNLSYECIYGPTAYRPAEMTVQKDYFEFSKYIKNAKEASKQREEIKANFFRVDGTKEFSLSKWYKISLISKSCNGAIVSSQQEIDTLIKFGNKIEDIKINQITVDGSNIAFFHTEDGIFCEDIANAKVIINDNAEIYYNLDEYHPESVMYSGVVLLVRNNKIYIEDFSDEFAYDRKHSFIKFSVNSLNAKYDKSVVTIELEDDENTDESVYEVFFGENVDSIIIDGNKSNSFRIKRRNKEYGQLELEVRDKNLIPQSGVASISSNTYQLACQARAIDLLVKMPSYFHRPLLYLSDDVMKSRLDGFLSYSEKSLNYIVLNNEHLKGNQIQRTFVQKALQTPDFMILEGPPGSGKTTSILEFIYQVLKEGKKVLLTASTHVAIDNVLEKIIKHPNRRELLKYINPVRIGSEDDIYVDEVKKYTYDNIMSKISPNMNEIVEDSFNLVCGTTIGILKYPQLKKSLDDQRNNQKNVEPIFDYLIIDEASKTTFNEFLVPAIFAKQWIIVGDVKQLAPYVEKNDLIPTLVNCKSLRKEYIRDAIYFIQMIQRTDKKEYLNSGFLMEGSTISYIDKYISQINNNTSFVAITNSKTSNLFTITADDIQNGSYKLTALDTTGTVFLIEESLSRQVLPYLQIKTKVVGKKINITRDKYFDQYSILHHRNTDFYKDTSSLDDLYSKKLEDEILWRLIRLYELSHTETNAVKSYRNYIAEIIQYIDDDNQKDYSDTINMINEIALPSIITLLQQGIKEKSSNTRKTILNSGLTSEDKINRFVSLEYQYRMHKDISRISRKYVYNENALKDDTRTYPEFHYFRDGNRFEIIDVPNALVNRNQNKSEADRVLSEMKLLAEFTQKNKIEMKLAILSFYNGQITLLRKEMQKYFKTTAKYNFTNGYLSISLNTVDKFQGQEADVVFLTMVRNDKIGFMDSINRVNVAITRAKDKLIVFGDSNFFKGSKHDSQLLRSIFNGGM